MMTTIQLTTNNDCHLLLPDGFEPVPLPYFNEWINALESGDYPQITGLLDSLYGGYCCLGVLSKIQGNLIDGKDMGRTYTELNQTNPCYLVLGAIGTFPKNTYLAFKDTYHVSNLTHCNDRLYLSFITIAEVIKHLWKPVECLHGSS